jgi:multidrug efflux system membrane fusion protein
MDDLPTRPYGPPPATPLSPEGEPELPLDEPARPVHPAGDEAPPARRRSRWRGLVWLVLLAAIAGVVVWYATRSDRSAGPSGRFQSGGPLPVGTATVAKGDMPVTLGGLGTVTPLATVTVKTQINGYLAEIGFTEGQMVKKGDFLAQIDPRPYQVALEQAQGQLAKDQAALANARVDLARYEKLVAQNSIARQTLDTQRATVAQDEGTVQTDQAQVDAQKLNLIYCHIIAPVGGRVGLRQVDAGNYVQTSDANGIVVITQLQPISVIFTLPEDDLPAVLARLHAGAKLEVAAFDRTGKTKIETGALATLDNQIDTTTGTVKLRADFDNAASNLFPNQFVNAQLLVNTLKDTAVIPDSAVQRGAPGTFVYLVKPDDAVTAQSVTLGPDDGQHVAVLKGLNPGDVIVTDGADRLKDGAKVTLAGGNGAQRGQGQSERGQSGQRQGGQGQAQQGQAQQGQAQQGQAQQGQAQQGQAQQGQAQQGQAQQGQAQQGQAQQGQAQQGQAQQSGQAADPNQASQNQGEDQGKGSGNHQEHQRSGQ